VQIAKKIINMTSCQSTNSEAMTLIKEKKTTEGLVVNTFSQTNGRGQQQNLWHSAPQSNLTFSLVLHPTFLLPTEQFQLTIACSLALTSFLTSISGKMFQIKWPNDILYRNKKICGILIENIIKGKTISHSIIGIGLNINQKSFPLEKAISLSLITNKTYDLPLLLDKLTDTILAYYGALKSNENDFKKEYLHTLFQYEEWTNYIVAEQSITGRIIGISDIGMLRMELLNGSIQEFGLKEIRFVY